MLSITLGAAFPSMLIPEPLFAGVPPDFTQGIACDRDAIAIIFNTLLRMTGLASPVAKIPSRLHLVKVQLATVGVVDSIQTPVPRACQICNSHSSEFGIIS
jgi:hypothetical protein